ncbi:MAG TPA: sulfite exporter TauE/SafE family protein [Casimicrobiaceae bacterium]
MSTGLLLSAWLVGALGGVHCLAMCGGLSGALAARDAALARPLLPARVVALHHAGYHAGRIATYALLGTLFGAAGAATLGAVDIVPLQRAIYAGANVFLLLLGASLVVRIPAALSLQRVGARTVAPLLRALQPAARRPGPSGRIALGLAWGLMPCALIYGVLPLALLAGGAWQGGLVMLAFGLGTLPNLLATGVLLSRARRFVSAVAVRRGAAAAMVAFGLLGIWRVFFVSDALAQGPFCLVP